MTPATQWDPRNRLADYMTAPSAVDSVRRRLGVVGSVKATGADVELGDSGTVVPSVKWVTPYFPVAGDVVWVDFSGPDPSIIGKAGPIVAAQGAYQTPALVNSWANYGGGHQTARYWLDTDGWVHVEGLVFKTGTFLNETIFNFPTGFRPTRLWQQDCIIAGDVIGGLRVDTSGNLQVSANQAGGTTGYVSLDGFVFPTTNMDASSWVALQPLNGWTEGISAVDPDRYVSAYMRDDGWCNVQGFTQSGTIGVPAFVIPELMRGRKGNTYVGLGWNGTNAIPNRVDVSRSLLSVVTGTNSQLNFEGIRWFSRFTEGHYVNQTPQNAWVRFDNNWPTAGMLLDKHGVVHLRGLIRSGTMGTVALTLPVGSRPLLRRVFVAAAGGVQGRADVHNDGTVVPVSGSNAFFDLSQITFRPEQ